MWARSPSAPRSTWPGAPRRSAPCWCWSRLTGYAAPRWRTSWCSCPTPSMRPPEPYAQATTRRELWGVLRPTILAVICQSAVTAAVALGLQDAAGATPPRSPERWRDWCVVLVLLTRDRGAAGSWWRWCAGGGGREGMSACGRRDLRLRRPRRSCRGGARDRGWRWRARWRSARRCPWSRWWRWRWSRSCRWRWRRRWRAWACCWCPVVVPFDLQGTGWASSAVRAFRGCSWWISCCWCGCPGCGARGTRRLDARAPLLPAAGFGLVLAVSLGGVAGGAG